MQIEIRQGEGAPIYRQIVTQIRYAIASGRLSPGQEVPPIRVLAERLTVNPNTVARAYMELERSGDVVKRHGAGTYVAESPPTVSKSQRERILRQRVDALLMESRQLGMPFETLQRLMVDRHQRLSLEVEAR